MAQRQPFPSIRHGLDERVPSVGVEEHVDLGGHVVGQLEQLLARSDGDQHRGGAFLNCEFDHTYRIVQRIDGTAQIQPANDHQAAS